MVIIWTATGLQDDAIKVHSINYYFGMAAPTPIHVKSLSVKCH